MAILVFPYSSPEISSQFPPSKRLEDTEPETVSEYSHYGDKRDDDADVKLASIVVGGMGE